MIKIIIEQLKVYNTEFFKLNKNTNIIKETTQESIFKGLVLLSGEKRNKAIEIKLKFDKFKELYIGAVIFCELYTKNKTTQLKDLLDFDKDLKYKDRIYDRLDFVFQSNNQITFVEYKGRNYPTESLKINKPVYGEDKISYFENINTLLEKKLWLVCTGSDTYKNKKILVSEIDKDKSYTIGGKIKFKNSKQIFGYKEESKNNIIPNNLFEIDYREIEETLLGKGIKSPFGNSFDNIEKLCKRV